MVRILLNLLLIRANEIDKIENYEQSTSQLREEIKTLYNEVIDIGKTFSRT